MEFKNRLSGKILECVNTIKGSETTRSTKSRVSITGFVYDSLSKIVPDKKPPPTPKRDYNEDQNRPTEPDDDPGWGSDFSDDDAKDYVEPIKQHIREFNNNDARSLMNPPPVPSTAGRRAVPPIPNAQKTLPTANAQKGHRELPPVPGQNESYVRKSPPKPMPQQVPVERLHSSQDQEVYEELIDEDAQNIKEQFPPPPRPTRFGGPIKSPSQPHISTSPTSSISLTSPTNRKFSLPGGDNNNNKRLPPVPKIPTPAPGHKHAGTFLKSQSCSTLTPTPKGLSIHSEIDNSSDKQFINNRTGLNDDDDESVKLLKPSDFRDRFKKFENAQQTAAVSVKKSQSFQSRPNFPSGESVDSGHGSDPPSPRLKIPSHPAPTRNPPLSPPVPVSPPAQLTTSTTATTRLTSVGRVLPPAPKHEEIEGLYSHTWYHGDVTRDDSKKNLEKHAVDGMFLVRKSAGTNTACPYALSLYQSGAVYNLHIRLRKDNKYALGMEKPDEPAFLKVPDLVVYFMSNTLLLSGQRAAATKLTTSAPQAMRH